MDVQDTSALNLTYHPQHSRFNRISDFCRSAINRWQGLVQVSMTDLGGNLDILASVLSSERLLMDLYDQPEEVKRLLWQAHELWHRYYHDFQSILQPVNPGYSGWESLFSEESFYMLQCDFCYMISPAMFDKFVRPELVATCKRLGNTFYHLDGKGELPHLDSLLSIEELKGIQWVAGAGQLPATHYIDLYRRILSAGKHIQLLSSEGMTFDLLEEVLNRLGTGKDVFTQLYIPVEQEEIAHRRLERLGVK
jgi:5-methyltetrahydrofolate--homocysteine methyltransferase